MKTFLLYGIIGLLLTTTLVFAHKYYSIKPVIKIVHPELSEKLTVPMTKYKDTQGIDHLVVDANVNKIIASEKSQQVAIIKPIIDQLAKDLQIQPKQIESSSTISTEVYQKDVQFLQKQVDSLKRVTYTYKDKYLSLAVKPPLDTDILPSFDFKYNADLNITQHWEKKWFLGAKYSKIDISSNDPRTTIKGFRTFTVVQKQPSLGLRFQAVARYSFGTSQVSLGPALRFDIKDLSIRASYLHNEYFHKWAPNITVEYNIIKF